MDGLGLRGQAVVILVRRLIEADTLGNGSRTGLYRLTARKKVRVTYYILYQM